MVIFSVVTVVIVVTVNVIIIIIIIIPYHMGSSWYFSTWTSSESHHSRLKDGSAFLVRCNSASTAVFWLIKNKSLIYSSYVPVTTNMAERFIIIISSSSSSSSMQLILWVMTFCKFANKILYLSIAGKHRLF
jgi:hypothetical protein